MPAKTRRGKQNYCYAARAAKTLLASYDDSLRYLFKPEMKITILGALGRVEDTDTRRMIAQEICKSRAPAARAVALVRHAMNRTKPADPVKLSHAIYRTIEKYRTRHPGAVKSCRLRSARKYRHDVLYILSSSRHSSGPERREPIQGFRRFCFCPPLPRKLTQLTRMNSYEN